MNGIIVLLISVSGFCHYSEPYDSHLEKLLYQDTKQSLIVAQSQLSQAKSGNESEKQLIALYYIVEAMIITSDLQNVESLIAQGFNLAKSENNIQFTSEFIGLRAYLDEINGDYESASRNANKALMLAQETSDKRLYGTKIALRGQIHMALDNYDLAIADVKTAIDIFKQNNDNQYISENYNLLAIIYHSIDDSKSALKYYQESQKYDLLKSPYDQSTHYYNLGAVYMSMDDYDKAIEYYNKSRAISQKLNDIYSLAFINYGMAENYLLQDKITDAENSLSHVFSAFEANNDTLMLMNSNLLMSNILTLKKAYTQALPFLNAAEVQSKKLGTLSAEILYSQHKIDYFVYQYMWQEAYLLTEKMMLSKDENQQESNDHLVSELKVKFNAQFDQEKLSLLQNQNRLQKDALMQDNTIKKYLWGLVGLTLSIIAVLYFAFNSQRKAKRHLYNLSNTDYLTQVSNRRHIIEKLKQLNNTSINHNQKFTVIMIDLDYFKKINDQYGHDVGNEVLIYFAQTAQRVMNQYGIVGRIGGEEWLIILPNIDKDQVNQKLDELRTEYKEAISIKIPKDCDLSFSSGIVMCNGQYNSHENILFDADVAMYQAKDGGRQRDVFV